ncbi:OmpA family protein [Galbibacter sp. PAP.153]|uniref:OmpA family protein n=1 Tax=Galbibacter sp. PAP.153 TaxID=3104623 RepID=UPI00300983C5
MIYINRITVCLILCLLWSSGYSQEQKLKKAQKEYEQLGFIKASEIYEKVADKGYRSVELFEKLGNTYYFNARYKEAAKWYKELFAMDTSIAPVYYRRYSQSLKATGADRLAQEMYNAYVDISGTDKERMLKAEDYLKRIADNSGRYTIKNLPVNTDGIDFGGYAQNGKLIYASTRDTGTLAKRKSAWDGLTFLDLYEVSVDSGGSYGPSFKIKGDINTRFHESSACVTRDGKTLYFTRNNTTPEMKRQKKEFQRLKIYRATLIDGKWTNVEDLSINGDTYSTAHPVLSPAEDKLYFVSNRPEAIGATDIFYAAIKADGSLGRVENMGKTINTYGRESFPFVSDRNELYFSSDGHFGLGGYDVFYVQLSKNGTESQGSLLNVGRAVNSAMDDVAFSINTQTHKGYISSNRAGGLGYDDIYGFTETKDIRELIQAQIHGTVIDKNTGEPIANSKIGLFYQDGTPFISVVTDMNGTYSITTDRYASYAVRASKEGYGTDEAYSLRNKKTQEINFRLERDLYALTEGSDLGRMLGIKEIYFDFDKWDIRPDAEVELQKVLTVMEQYPTLSIAIKSHTDSRGNDAYNQLLSEKRARSTKQYLLDKGINEERLSAMGYGESRPVNKCTNGVKCTEREHQQNRRSEFIIGILKK